MAYTHGDDSENQLEIDEERDFDFEDEPRCHTCGGEGIVESVAEASGRYGWDDDDIGTCPNCRGSGLAKDCTTF